MLKTVEMDFEYLNYIDRPPVDPKMLWKKATSSDDVTNEHWKDIWIGNYKANHEKCGSFLDNHIGQLFGLNAMKPAIVLGSGPSLVNNIKDIAKNTDIMTLSCLHNFHICQDNDVKVDYYVSLDAGDVTIEEISEGGKLSHEEYLEKTEGCKLLAFAGSSPKLIDAWRGEVVWFHCGLPDPAVRLAMDAIEKFGIYISTGGNVLGAATYIARAIFGSNPVALAGADFCFSYNRTFHGWKSKYDQEIGIAQRAVDVWGNKVLTWGSYHNFKCWFDGIAMKVPGFWVNITEGGTWGAYPEGNLRQIHQMAASDFIRMYDIYKEMEYQCGNPENPIEPGMTMPKVLF